MRDRRELLKGLLVTPWWSSALYAQATRGMPPLRIKEIKVLATSPTKRYSWVFVKVITSEPGLYGIGSAANAYLSWSVKAAIEKHLGPFWIGKDPDRIEQLSQASHVRSYWRNGPVINTARAALDMALWDIKGKRANMPVYQLLGGKVREAVPLYAHAGGKTTDSCIENVQKLMEEGYRHIRVQLGGYGGGGFVPSQHSSRPEKSPPGPGFDEDLYVETIANLFKQVRDRLGWNVKLLHDVHSRLTPTAARKLAQRLESVRMFFVEDILPPEHMEHFRQIRPLTTTPMAMGELFTHPLEWRPLITERLIDFIRCRISSIGGITPARKIAALCDQFGVRTAWQEGGENDPVNQLAAYHVDLTIPAFGIQEKNAFPDVVHEVLPGAAEIRGGYLYGNDKPGLGIDINEALVAKYPLADNYRNADWTTIRAIDGSVIRP